MPLKIDNRLASFNLEIKEIGDFFCTSEDIFEIFLELTSLSKGNTFDKIRLTEILNRYLIVDSINEEEKKLFISKIDMFQDYIDKKFSKQNEKGDLLEYIISTAKPFFIGDNYKVYYEVNIYSDEKQIGEKYFDLIKNCTESEELEATYVSLDKKTEFIECKHNISTFIHCKHIDPKSKEKLDYIVQVKDEIDNEIYCKFAIATFKQEISIFENYFKNTNGGCYSFIKIINGEDICSHIFN